jgi:hypothetical protein
MLHPALDLGENLASIAFEPMAVEGFGHDPELDDKIPGEVFRLGLAAFFPPQAKQGRLVLSHDDPGIRAANEAAPIR